MPMNTDEHSMLNDPSLIGNTQQLSSASNCININGGVNPSGCYPCVHYHSCGCHCSKRMKAMKAAEAAYLDSLPIGCRFLPTDKELIVHYLKKKIKNENLPKNKISEANVYGYHPKDLAANYPQAIEGAWYFFSSRDRKYGHGNRPRRNAGAGYWKATGLHRVIKDNEYKIGSRKSLVYYEGHQPNGTKTSWIMHEYVVEDCKRQPLGSDDKKFDDYVLCKIYKNGRMKDEVVSDQQPRVTSNDQDENLRTDIDPDQNKLDDVVTQHISPTIGQVMVHDQHAHVVLNQDVNPTSIQVDNNHVVVLQSNQNSNPTIHHGEYHLRAENVAKEAKQQVMVRDQQACVVSSQDINPTVLQVENNVVVQSNQTSGSLYDLIMKASTRYSKPVEGANFQPIRAPLVHQTCPARLDNKYSLQNPPYFSPTRQRSQSLPPLHRHRHPGMYMYGPSSNPPSTQVTPPTFQNNNECDGRVIFERNIKLMFAKDGYDGLNFDNNFRFQFDTDESKKHA